MRTRARYKYFTEVCSVRDEEGYREIIDLDEQKRKKWILLWRTILVVILIIAGLILLNYLKIDQNGRIYLEKKQKIEDENYI